MCEWFLIIALVYVGDFFILLIKTLILLQIFEFLKISLFFDLEKLILVKISNKILKLLLKN